MIRQAAEKNESVDMSAYPLLQFSGPDAGRFLQAQLATDLSTVAVGQWRWAALLSLKGRVLAHAPLARVEEQRWLWWLPPDLLPSIADHLRRYLLRSKLQLGPVIAGIGAVPAATPADAAGRIETEAAGAHRLISVAPGWDLLWHLAGGEPAAAELDPMALLASAVDLQLWQLARLRARLAWISAASSDRHLPQPLGLLELGSVSVRKGCYPGQEIVARTHYLGRSKRVSCLLEGAQPVPDCAASVLQGDRIVGEIVEVLAEGERFVALAVVEESALGAGELGVEGRLVG